MIGAVGGAAHFAALRMRDNLTCVAASHLNLGSDEARFASGRIFARPIRITRSPPARSPGRAISRQDRFRCRCHGTARDRVPGAAGAQRAERSRSNQSCGHLRFRFQFLRYRDGPRPRTDSHRQTRGDAQSWRILNPVLFDGQVLSGFAHGRGAALYEVLAYSDDGRFLSGTFADYPVPTACEQTGCIARSRCARCRRWGAAADATTGRRARLAKEQMFDLGRS